MKEYEIKDYVVTIEENPDGYSEGTYGYVIEKGSLLWFDGGYASVEHAMECAEKFIEGLEE